MTFEGGRGGGGVWVFSEKNNLQTDFEGKKIIARKYLAKKIPTLKKYLSRRIKLEKNLIAPLYGSKKNSITRGLGAKKFLPKPNHPSPPSPKSQMVGPYPIENVTVYVYKLGSKLERAG